MIAAGRCCVVGPVVPLGQVAGAALGYGPAVAARPHLSASLPRAGGAAVALLALGLAAGAGPLLTLRRIGAHRLPPAPLTPAAPSVAPASPSAGAGHGAGGLHGLVLFAAALAALLALAVLGWLVWLATAALADLFAGRTRALPGDASDEPVTRTTPATARRRLQDGTAAAAEALERTEDPRRAVLACWLELERAAARAGAPRGPAQTSVELARQLLASFAIDPTGLQTLHRLYQQARFSPDPVGSQARDLAREALAGVRDALRQPRPVLAAASPAADTAAPR